MTDRKTLFPPIDFTTPGLHAERMDDAPKEEAVTASQPASTELDNCQLCKGANGGVPGNENRLPNGLVVCDYCHATLIKNGASQPASVEQLLDALIKIEKHLNRVHDLDFDIISAMNIAAQALAQHKDTSQ